MFIHYTNFQIDCIKLYIHCCPFSHRRTLVFNGSIWFLVFFPMHSCHSVSGSMCNECMLVGSLVGWTDGWMVGYTFQCSECCIVYMESVCSSGQYIYTRTYYIVANAFAIFVYISKSMITLCRPGPGQQKSTITIIVIIDSQFLCCSLDSVGFFIEDQLKRVGWLVGPS